jgi:TolB-like protein
MVSAMLVGWIMLARGGGSTTIRSLAVLPLDSLSSDPSQEYFADGMTDQLITTLGADQRLARDFAYLGDALQAHAQVAAADRA